MQPKAQVSVVEQVNRPLVRSSNPLDRNVQAICHHSDEYLCREDVSPSSDEAYIGLLAQHDFPGVPGLDAQFRSAAHGADQQHLQMMPHMVLAYVLGILGAIGLATVLIASLRGVAMQFPLLLAASSVLFLGLAAALYWKRHDVYHQMVRLGMPARLKVDDFPLDCTYDIAISEKVTATLDNRAQDPPTPSSQHGSVTVSLYPEPTSRRHLPEYLRLWQQSGFSGKIYAGLVALQQTANVDFPPSAHISLGHRISLSARMPNAFRTGTYSAKQHGPLLKFHDEYSIKPAGLYTEKDPLVRRFPLECIPYLDPDNSFALKLQFRWIGDEGRCWLEECRLAIPPNLGVNEVEYGYFDTAKNEAVWKGINFAQASKDQALTLTIHCKSPILTFHEVLEGSYSCVVNNYTLSKMSVRPDHIWNARGHKAVAERTPYIQRKTFIDGKMAVDVKRLMQDHEHTQSRSVDCRNKNKTAAQVAANIVTVFKERNIDLLRIAQPAPRLDPAGTLSTELHYWDVIGRIYQPAIMTPIDIHVVIRSKKRDMVSQTQPQQSSEYAANIDIRMRGLYDPRNIDYTGPNNRLCKGLPTFINDTITELAKDIDAEVN